MSEETEVEEVEQGPSWTAEELAALKKLIEERMRGEFVSMEEGGARTEKMIADKRKEYGL